MDRRHRFPLGPGDVCDWRRLLRRLPAAAKRASGRAERPAARAQRPATRAQCPTELVRRLLELKRRRLSITALGHQYNSLHADFKCALPIKELHVYGCRDCAGHVEERSGLDRHICK